MTTTPDSGPRSSTELAQNQQRVTDNIHQLLDILPPIIRQHLTRNNHLTELLEIVLDLGRIPEARYPDRVVELGTVGVTEEDIDYVVNRVGSFGKDNRAGIERTLHRISAIRNRAGKVVGLTCRIGRAVYGTIDIIQDVVEGGHSILMLGKPGRGKTTKLREMARVLSDELKKRVVIVDTSNEIAGDGDIPHPAIGHARRMQVGEPSLQHAVMIEAVENHMPEVIVIDEIGTEQETFAARTIAERGVQLVGTAHGNCLENLLMNPTLSDLIGGIQAVTLSDEEAKRRGTQKTVLERKSPPTFNVIIEIMEVDKLAIHHDVQSVVDRLLRGQQPRPEIRVRNADGQIEILQKSSAGGIREIREEADEEAEEYQEKMDFEDRQAPRSRREVPPTVNSVRKDTRGIKRIFPYGVNRNRLDRAILESHLQATVARDISEADVVLALKASFRREPARMRDGSAKNLPTFIVKSNTFAQIQAAVRDIFQAGPLERGYSDEAVREAEEGVHKALESRTPVDLSPQNSYVRRLQHQVVERSDMLSESIGDEPRRRVRIFPNA
ncbi:MAG: R3H domain-containing nucleic acid-binding protein [Chthonomonadales bacterium]